MCWRNRRRARLALKRPGSSTPKVSSPRASSTNAWIVTGEGVAGHPAANREILHGVARATLLDVAADLGLELQLRPFTVAEAYEAREAFFSSASMRAMPVIEIDGRVIGDGRPGEVTYALRRRFHELAALS